MNKLLVLSLFFTVACAQKTEAPPPKASTTAAPTSHATAATPAATPVAMSCKVDTECGDKQLCVRNQCVEISGTLAECSTIRVHFDVDATDLRGDDRKSLERMARCLRGDHALHVTIEGNADERGTEEYNLSLGERRAVAVDKYLVTMGVSDTQLKTISYGKENPICREHDEACWEKNRRAAVKPVEAKAAKKK